MAETKSMSKTVLLKKSWPNSMSDKGFHKNYIAFETSEDGREICFSFSVLFDADEDDWDNGHATFPIEDLATCLAQLEQNGKGEMTTTEGSIRGATLRLTRIGPKVRLEARCSEQGITHTFEESLQTIIQKLSIT